MIAEGELPVVSLISLTFGDGRGPFGCPIRMAFS